MARNGFGNLSERSLAIKEALADQKSQPSCCTLKIIRGSLRRCLLPLSKDRPLKFLNPRLEILQGLVDFVSHLICVQPALLILYPSQFTLPNEAQYDRRERCYRVIMTLFLKGNLNGTQFFRFVEKPAINEVGDQARWSGSRAI